VAQRAAPHLIIVKEAENERTHTMICPALGKQRDKELQRMRGEA
jgi:DNA repair ATPase RecN